MYHSGMKRNLLKCRKRKAARKKAHNLNKDQNLKLQERWNLLQRSLFRILWSLVLASILSPEASAQMAPGTTPGNPSLPAISWATRLRTLERGLLWTSSAWIQNKSTLLSSLSTSCDSASTTTRMSGEWSLAGRRCFCSRKVSVSQTRWSGSSSWPPCYDGLCHFRLSPDSALNTTQTST